MEFTYKFVSENVTIEITEEWHKRLKEFDKDEYNNWHKLDRHSKRVEYIISAYSDGENFSEDFMDMIPDDSLTKRQEEAESYDMVCEFIRKNLKAEFADIVIAVALNRYKVKEYAEIKGISYELAKKRYQRGIKKLKKVSENCPHLFSPVAYK